VEVCRSGASHLAFLRVDVAEVLHHLERAAKMVTDDINARGGLLGRPIELFVEDSATEDDRAAAAAAKLVGADVDVVVAMRTAKSMAPSRR
jgi:ABC-type branched-subunit amino acid transport system substrate-binding protein